MVRYLLVAVFLVVVAAAMVVVVTSDGKEACAQAGNQRQHDQCSYQCPIFHVRSFPSGLLTHLRCLPVGATHSRLCFGDSLWDSYGAAFLLVPVRSYRCPTVSHRIPA